MLFAILIDALPAASGGDFPYWGKVSWVAAVVLIGIGIWFFKGRNRRED